MALFHLVLCYDSGVKSGTVMSGDSPPSTPLPNFSKFSSHLLFTSWRVKDWRLYNGRINQLVSSTTSTSRELSNDVLLIKKKCHGIYYSLDFRFLLDQLWRSIWEFYVSKSFLNFRAQNIQNGTCKIEGVFSWKIKVFLVSMSNQRSPPGS